MKRVLCIGVAVAVASAAPLGQESGSAPARRTIDTYCVGCHSSAVKAGGLALDNLPLDKIREHPQIWEGAVRKLRGRLMPPPGSRQPPQREIDAFVAFMEAELDRAAATY